MPLTFRVGRLAFEGYGMPAGAGISDKSNVEASNALPRGPDAPWVPARAAVASVPGEGGWIPVPFWDALVHPHFC